MSSVVLTALAFGVSFEELMKPERKRVLFIGLAHRASDPRLCHFLGAALKSCFPTLSCYYIGRESSDPEAYSNDIMTVLPMPGGINPKKRRFRFADAETVGRYVANEGFDLVQVSDFVELKIGVAVKRIAGIPVIYDSHEDYFCQKYEYKGRSIVGLLSGAVARLDELLMVRSMDAVFCTDDYLPTLYGHPVMGGVRAVMVRNIPPESMICDRPAVRNSDHLKLVYFGSVNPLRGVIETANFAARFNEENLGFTVSFHLFSKEEPIVRDLHSKGLVTYHGFLPYESVPARMRQFDVGVSLLQWTKKFERNIPIKNFEYMAVGLPILTSNFGQMKKWVTQAGAGLTIAPRDYDAFKSALLRLKDAGLRRTLGENGIAYAKKNFIRSKEVAPYLKVVGELLGM
jgi:glycosyltransferase involved in cell wall biosynthesis